MAKSLGSSRSLNVQFIADRILDLEESGIIPQGSLKKLAPKLQSAAREYTRDRTAKMFNTQYGSAMSAALTNVTPEQQQSAFNYINNIIQQELILPAQERKISAPTTENVSATRNMTDAEKAAVSKRITDAVQVNYGERLYQPMKTVDIPLPKSQALTDTKTTIKSALGDAGKLIQKQDGSYSVQYNPYASSAWNNSADGKRPLMLNTAVHRAIGEGKAALDAENVATETLTGMSPVGQPIEVQTELSKMALKEKLLRLKLGMPEDVRVGEKRSVYEKRIADNKASFAALQELSMGYKGIDDPINAMTAYAMDTGLMSSSASNSLFRMLPFDIQETIKRSATLQRAENLLKNPSFIEKQKELSLQKQAINRETTRHWFEDPEGGGYGTEEGLWRRRSRRRRQEAWDMRRSGRIGRALRRMGVSSKVAGPMGRVFGAMGGAAIIVAAIVALGKLLYVALNKIADIVLKIQQNASSKLLGNVFTGVSTIDQEMYTQFEQYAVKAGAVGVNINASNQAVANKIGNIAVNPGAAKEAIAGVAMLSAASGVDGINAVVNTVLKGEKDISVLTNSMTAAALAGIFKNNSLYGQNATATEYSAYMAQAGMDTAELGFLIQQLRKGDNEGLRKTFLADVSAAKSDPDRLKAIVDGLRKQLNRASDFAAEVNTPLKDSALSDMNDAFANQMASFASFMKQLKENLSFAFGESFLRLLQSFQDGLINFLGFFDKWVPGGVPGFKNLARSMNQSRLEAGERKLAGLEGMAGTFDQRAIDTYKAYFYDERLVKGADGRYRAVPAQETDEEIHQKIEQWYREFGTGKDFGKGVLPERLSVTGATKSWTDEEYVAFATMMKSLQIASNTRGAVQNLRTDIAKRRAAIEKEPNYLYDEIATQVTPATIVNNSLEQTRVVLEKQVQMIERTSKDYGIRTPDGYHLAKAIAYTTEGDDARLLDALIKSISNNLHPVLENINASPINITTGTRFDKVIIEVQGELPGARILTPEEIEAVTTTRLNNAQTATNEQ